jgi:hypothetical protein
MKTLLVSIALGVLLSLVYIDTGLYSSNSNDGRVADPMAQQPREKYVPPEWVINGDGQRCIKQGDVITCG